MSDPHEHKRRVGSTNYWFDLCGVIVSHKIDYPNDRTRSEMFRTRHGNWILEEGRQGNYRLLSHLEAEVILWSCGVMFTEEKEV